MVSFLAQPFLPPASGVLEVPALQEQGGLPVIEDLGHGVRKQLPELSMHSGAV